MWSCIRKHAVLQSNLENLGQIIFLLLLITLNNLGGNAGKNYFPAMWLLSVSFDCEALGLSSEWAEFHRSERHFQFDTIGSRSSEEAWEQVTMETGKINSVEARPLQRLISQNDGGGQGQWEARADVSSLALAWGEGANYCCQTRQSINLHKSELPFK